MTVESDTGAPVLASQDLQSATWAKLRKHMEARLQSLRIKNDTDLAPVDTAKVRGEIKNLKNLLALGKPNQAMVADEKQPE